ncbi:myelin and lymphocyte protein-like [Ctenopharyngodon idella]|uniref:myelin and lymphocyte protein-like n=1 Tax=Ctenopharyngodon idella TaxID=7959 RepID=UPI00222F753E|nr:myelin and lymphocyte protein-like [Ctenopharyngodon idella]XP_051768989.1 myelin and lymphocyte protein-like [Ctenopharyngodon idella]XP_051768990.1 myelin and lymphocyte protein-like [Ctenopharyngodon idella]
MASNTGQMGYLPSGGAIFCTIPDIFYLPELVFGGLVLCLVASTYLDPPNPQAYVISVTIFCFIMSFLWLMVFACGSHRNKSSWASADVAYHAFAALLYLSASVLLAFITIFIGDANLKETILYKLDVAAVVFSFLTTLLYVIHTIFSALRWKSF